MRPASRGDNPAAPLNSRSVSFQGNILAGAAFSFSLLSPPVASSPSVGRRAKCLSSSSRFRRRLHADRCTPLSGGDFGSTPGWRAQSTSGCGAARATWCYPRNIVGLKSNQSLERTRGAPAVRLRRFGIVARRSAPDPLAFRATFSPPQRFSSLCFRPLSACRRWSCPAS